MAFYRLWRIALSKTTFFTVVGSFFRALLSPPFCVACRMFLEKRVPLCDTCSAHVRLLAPLTLAITPSYAVPVIVYGAYEEPLRSLILAKNYKNKIAAHQAGALLAQHVRQLSLVVDYIVPVPLHWMRHMQRGYNQSREMAQAVAEVYNVPVVMPVKRVRATRPQKECSGDEREQNVRDAFQVQVNDVRYRGKHLMVVDDVVTTGATTKAMVKELKKLQPASITVVALCRVI